VETISEVTIDFTVAIPTYNGAKRLPAVLDRLKKQVGSETIAWEVIAIDNNSCDNTAQVIRDYQENWTESFPLKYYRETQQGLAFARQRAVQEARGELIGFIDDDNWPDRNWVRQAYDFGQKYSKAGAYSGQIHADFEVQPPENFQRIHRCLAIAEHGSQAYKFDPDRLQLPPGAGLVIRKKAWLENVPSRLTLLGRVGGAKIAGEDYETLLYLHKAGWEIWYNPQMHINHQIPRDRLERDYLLPIARGCGLPICQLRMIAAPNWQKPAILLRTLFGNLRRVIVHRIKYREKIETDLIAAFELEFYWGSMMSPFYFLKQRFLSKS